MKPGLCKHVGVRATVLVTLRPPRYKYSPGIQRRLCNAKQLGPAYVLILRINRWNLTHRLRTINSVWGLKYNFVVKSIYCFAAFKEMCGLIGLVCSGLGFGVYSILLLVGRLQKKGLAPQIVLQNHKQVEQWFGLKKNYPNDFTLISEIDLGKQ